MARKKGTTREGVPDEVVDSTQSGEDVTQDVERQTEVVDEHQEGHPLSPDARESAIESIARQRRESLDAEAGTNVSKSDDADETKEPAQIGDEDALQREIQAEQILADEALKNTKVKVVIDGEERMMTAEEMRRIVQKNESGDKKLREAAQMRADVERMLQEAQQKKAEAVTQEEKKEAEHDVEAAKAAKELYQQALNAMYEGDTEKAVEFLDQAVEKKVASRATQAPAAPNLEEVVKAVRQEISVEDALAKFKADYPTIWSDKDYAALANRKVAELMSDPEKPLSEADAILESGRQLAEKFKLDTFDPGRQQDQATTDRRTQVAARKAELDEPPAASVKARVTQQDPESPDKRRSVIAEIAEARGKAM